MSPNPKYLGISPTETILPKACNKLPEKEREIIREEIFTRTDNPFYLDQRTWNIVCLGSAHLFAIYYFYLDFNHKVPRGMHLLFQSLYALIGGLGITVGCHRYWTHKTFKAKRPLQILLMIMQTSAFQYHIHKWCLDHRIHHKYTDTNADPHNSKRGFWFSHMGWLFLPRHPEYQKKLKTFDMSDLENDPIVRFQCRWHLSLSCIFVLIIPISMSYFVFRMPLLYSVAANFWRYVIILHATWCVNSVAHIWGDKPYDKGITAVDNPIVSLIAVGEAYHNYHHVFPWDYKASEFGWKCNLSTMFIDFFAWIGWAYDLKTVSQKMLNERCQRTGNRSNELACNSFKNSKINGNDKDFQYKLPDNVGEVMKTVDEGFWGWDDDSIPDEFRKATKILQPAGEFSQNIKRSCSS